MKSQNKMEEKTMIFKGYVIIYKNENGENFYLLKSLEKGNSLGLVDMYKSIFNNDNIHKIKEDEIDGYIKELKEKGFNVGANISIFILNNKPFIGKFSLV